MMSTLSNPMNISPFFRCFSLFSTCLLDFYPPFFGYPFTGSFPNIIFSRKKGCHLWGSLPGHLLCSHFSSTLNDSSASLSLKNMLLTARFISQIAEIQVCGDGGGLKGISLPAKQGRWEVASGGPGGSPYPAFHRA